MDTDPADPPYAPPLNELRPDGLPILGGSAAMTLRCGIDGRPCDDVAAGPVDCPCTSCAAYRNRGSQP